MYIIPVNGPVVVTSYLARSDGEYHQGLDIGSRQKSPAIIAADTGIVRTISYDPTGYGNYAILRHDNGEYTLYGHMSEEPSVSRGQNLRQGDVIGAMGETGNARGRHVHFEILVPPAPDDFWAKPRWKYRKNPFLEVDAFKADSFGGQEAQKTQKVRWITAIAEMTKLTTQEVEEELIRTGALVPSTPG